MKEAQKTRVHKLKTWPKYFESVMMNRKNFEVRKDDRDFQEGDTLCLEEYNPGWGYTGRVVKRRIAYKLDDRFEGLKKGFCVLGIEKLYE